MDAQHAPIQADELREMGDEGMTSRIEYYHEMGLRIIVPSPVRIS